LPLLLAIESATEVASVALARDGATLAVRRTGPGRPASEALLPAVLDLLAEAGAGLDAVDAFAVSVGPGSFTGLRVGVSTVKGLAFGGDRPVVAVPTLAALALRAARPEACVAALLDARRGEVYAALHAGDAREPALLAAGVLRPADLVAALEAHAGARDLVAIGDGVSVVRDALAARFGARVAFVEGEAGRPDAVAVAALGARLLARGEGRDAAAIAPVYVRRAEAEVRRTGERFEP
jgi:tRNA threonylcarbamoyladenosine biosynthesis protein TsaB